MKDQEINIAIEKLAHHHQLAIENLTESQLADAIRQAILSGDFQRNISANNSYSVTYTPYRKLKDTERARDEAREDATNYYAKVGELTEERDKAQNLVDQYKEMLNQLAEPLLEKVDDAVQFRIKEIKEERDEAREELRNVHNLYCEKCDEILKLTFENRRLLQERDQYKEMLDMQTKIVVDLEMRLLKMKEQSKP